MKPQSTIQNIFSTLPGGGARLVDRGADVRTGAQHPPRCGRQGRQRCGGGRTAWRCRQGRRRLRRRRTTGCRRQRRGRLRRGWQARQRRDRRRHRRQRGCCRPPGCRRRRRRRRRGGGALWRRGGGQPLRELRGLAQRWLRSERASPSGRCWQSHRPPRRLSW